MAYPASIIAYAFVKKGIDAGLPVTQMKLQKMVYFAHGYHLAKYGKPLIMEEFQAWKFGPVVPSIYQTYKYYGSKPITNTYYIDSIISFNDAKLTASAIDAIEYTWKVTENISAEALSNWTHQPNTPWYKAYTPLRNVPIKNDDIVEYFTGLVTKTNARGTTSTTASTSTQLSYK